MSYGKIDDGGVTAPLGFRASAAEADVKGNGKHKKDVGLLVSDVSCAAAGLFTSNLAKAAPVRYDMSVLEDFGEGFRAVIANSGNANACTGAAGARSCEEIVAAVAKGLRISPSSVLAASTGVIGKPFPTGRILSSLPELIENLSDENGSEFAGAIMTTDTVSKQVAFLVETESGSFVVGGCCKGSGMIAPSIATMLVFLTTDAEISPDLLKKALREAADTSFNRLTVDGDMSTNDTAVIMANGMSGVKIKENDYKIFAEALSAVCLNLTKKMARDGEGATKFVTVRIKGAVDDDEARACASKIANSPLVKTMFAGGDPNWGRLISTAGASGAVFDPEKIDIYFDDLHYVENGVIIDESLEKEAFGIMKKDEYEVAMNLNAGNGEAVFYTCDLTVDYIKINADYRS